MKTSRAARVPSGVVGADAARASAFAPRPTGREKSFLEVRVAPGRLDVVEVYSHGQAARLRAALRGLGLLTDEEFEAPCG